MKLFSLTKLKEWLFLTGFFLLVFLPVRLIMFEYVSQHWIGSLGSLSIITLVIFYLARKNKLGYIGILLNNKINKIKTSKLTTLSLIVVIIMILILGISSAAFSHGPNSSYVSESTAILISNNVTSPEAVLIQYEAPTFEDILIGTTLPFTNFDLFSSIMHSIDNVTYDNWLSHFTLVMLVEEIELFFIIIYFRYIKK